MLSIRLIDDRIKMVFDKENMTMQVTQNITEEMRLKYDGYENVEDGTIYFVNKYTGKVEHEFKPCDKQ